MNRSQTRRVWPLVFSAAGGFLLAAFLFIPQLYSNNQNVYRVKKYNINVIQKIISYEKL